MRDCTNCGNAKYNPEFGERRCQVYNHSVRDPDKYVDCRSHKKRGENDERQTEAIH